MSASTSLIFNVIARNQTGPALNQASSGFSGFMGKASKLAGVGALALGGMFVKFSQDARESAKIGRMTEQVIKSTGGAAGLSANQIGNLATSISNKTGADDEAIQSGENLLLTFTNIKNGVGKNNDIFNQATQAAVDMSAAMNGGEVTADGLKTANIQLGKALNDPIKGVTALSKVGVSFTAQQKKQIETLVKSGHTMAAQKIILGEMKKEFGGMAAASSDPMTKLQTVLGNLAETLGGMVLPIIDKLATKMAQLSMWVQRNQTLVKVALITFAALAGIIWTVTAAMKAYKAIQMAFIAVTRGAMYAQLALNSAFLANPIVLVIAGLIALGVALVILWKKSETFRKIVTAAFDAVKAAANAVWDWIKGHWPLLLVMLTGPFGAAFLVIRKFWGQISDATTKGFNAVKTAATALWTFFTSLATKIVGLFRTAATWLLSAGRNIIAGLIAGIKFVWEHSVIGFMVSRRTAIVGFFSGAGGWLASKGRDVVTGFWNGLKEIWDKVTGWISGIAKWIKDHKGPVSLDRTLLVPAGKAIMQGFYTGLKGGAGQAWGFVKGVGGAISGHLADGMKHGIGFLKNLPDFAGAALGKVGGLVGKIFGSGGGGSNQGIGAAMAMAYGWTGDQWNALQQLWQNESGWNNNAQNPTSTAYGIPQFLDSTWAWMGYSKTSDPKTQIAAGLKYISQVYGSPSNALAQWNARSPHWYAKGGVINEMVLGVGRSGQSYVFGEAGPETVTPGIGGPRGRVQAGRQHVHVSFDFRGASDDALVEALRKAIRVRGGNVGVVLGGRA